MRTPMKLDTPILVRAVRVIKANAGISSAKIAEKLQTKQNYLGKALSAAKGFGLIGYVYVESGAAEWYPADKLQQAQKDAKRRADARRKERAHEHNVRSLRELRKVERETGEIPDADLAAKRTHIAAGQNVPLPFKCTAPASVFHLGGML